MEIDMQILNYEKQFGSLIRPLMSGQGDAATIVSQENTMISSFESATQTLSDDLYMKIAQFRKILSTSAQTLLLLYVAWVRSIRLL